MVLGMSPRVPGQLVGEQGPPLNNAQLRGLLDQLYRMADRPPVPTSGKRVKLDIENTLDATHVYCKVDKPLGLAPKFEGPYRIHSRPSRTQVEMEIGKYRDGKPRLLTVHWSQCKVAHLREGAPDGARPALGRPRNSPTSGQSEGQTTTEQKASSTTLPSDKPVDLVSEPASQMEQDAEKQTNGVRKQTNLDGGNIQTRPVRKSRNPNPKYIESIYQASKEDIAALNAHLNWIVTRK